MRSRARQKKVTASRARSPWGSWPRSARPWRRRLKPAPRLLQTRLLQTRLSANQSLGGFDRAHLGGGGIAGAGRSGELKAVEIQNKQAQARRQIALLALHVDRRHEMRQGRTAADRDLLERLPKRILETDAGLVAGNHDGTLDHG